ncbi:MFS transporter [Helicobacter labacensis]|uniref:MFS transporter n=1 Tax=Helicobacter labacensis TaxID=2316079 RepID=UPI000EB0BD48|nr:MFS transporter [Helicobacter labacensis]
MFFNKNILLLLLGQALSGAVVSLLTFSSALAGQWLLGRTTLATLPVSTTLCGAFIVVCFSASIFQRWGRKRVLLGASLWGVVGGGLAIMALWSKSFLLFCLATFLLGFFTALNQFYRFLAIEAINATHQNAQNRATTLVVSGGILGGILGPHLGNVGIHLFSVPFVGSFVFVGLLCALNLLLTLFLKLKPFSAKASSKVSFKTLCKEPHFLLATCACALGFGLMTLVMNATALAMHAHHFSYTQSQSVLVAHFVAMYAPSLFLALLVKNTSPMRLVMWGMLCYVGASVIALYSASFLAFWLCLVLVGIGWALSFNGGTFMLNAIQSDHKLRLQGLSSSCVFGANLCASSSVGLILAYGSWAVLHGICLGVVMLFWGLSMRLKRANNSAL